MASIGKRCQHENKTRCKCNWVLRYRDAAGKQREESYFYDQKEIATDRKIKIEHDLRAGQAVFSRRSGNETVGGFVSKWIEQHAASPKTKENYRSTFTRHINPAFGAVKLHQLRREHVRVFLLETMPKTVGHHSIVMARAVLVASLNEAVRQHKLIENPASGIRLPNGDSQRADFILATHDQLMAIEKELPDRWRIALWLMRGCGLRIGEALAVRSDSVRGDMLRVEEQVLGTGKRGPLKHRKPGEYRDVPLPTYLAEKIDAHVEDFGIESGGYLLPEVRQWKFRRAWNRGAQLAGLPDTFTPHDLRHTYASIALANGVPITDVSRWLGHRDINLTHSVYGHLVPAAAARAVAVIDGEYESWSA